MQSQSYADMTAEAPPAFRVWAKKHGLSGPRAAKKLGVCERQAYYYMEGRQMPTRPIRIMMALVDKGVEIPEPYPIDTD